MAPRFALPEIERMALNVAKSGMFGQNYEQTLTLMLLADAEGMHPAIAARDYRMIDGKMALKADAMHGRFLAASGKVKWHALTAKVAAATFSHPAGGTVRIDWTIRMATKAGLILDNPYWEKYPRACLRSRCIAEGVRTVYPCVIVGVYSIEELQDGVTSLDLLATGRKAA